MFEWCGFVIVIDLHNRVDTIENQTLNKPFFGQDGLISDFRGQTCSWTVLNSIDIQMTYADLTRILK